MLPALPIGTTTSRRMPLRRMALAIACALLSACNSLLFHPTTDWVRTPDDVGLIYRDVELIARDGTHLSSWWLPAKGTERGALVFLHGNAENISTHLASVYWLPDAGYSVLLLDYRGFGASEGSPALPGIFLDVDAALAWLVDHKARTGNRIFLLGQSIGASLGAHVVGSDARWQGALDGVILDAGFSRYSSVAQDVARKSWLTWPFQLPIAMAMPDGIDPVDSVANISPTPLMLIHSRQDAVVAAYHADLLFAAAGDPKRLLRYNGGHIQTFNFEENRQHLLDFLADPMSRR